MHNTFTCLTLDDLPLGLIPLAVDHKINHKYQRLLSIPTLNTACDRVNIPKATVISTLNPVETESTEISNISLTKTERSENDMRKSSTELPAMPPESSFQPVHNESMRQLIILQDTHVLQASFPSLPQM